jgi:prepilin-type N-terminal cleavage/methylation domain-containing protein
MSTIAKHPRGFTLIELMVVVTIIGVLSSIAFPQLKRAQLRARASERATIMDALGRGIGDTVTSLQGLPTKVVGDPLSGQFWIGEPNPKGVPGPSKRQVSYGTQAIGWQYMPVIIQGEAYYSYSFHVTDGGGNGTVMFVLAVGDLDADGVQSSKTINWKSRGYTFYKDSTDPNMEVPPAGQEDDLSPQHTF